MKKISLLIPVFNEQEVVSLLINRLDEVALNLPDYKLEYLFIDDGSSDDTVKILKSTMKLNSKVSYIKLSRNFGKEAALIAGLDHASGDAVVIIDADLQDPPELIPTLIKWWSKGYQDVYAKRRNRDGETFFKKMTSKIYYRILERSTSIPVQIDTGDFRLLDRKAIDSLIKYRETERNTKALFSLIGFRKKEILYDRDMRAAGRSKWNYRKLSNHAIDGITSFTTSPLRVASVLGVIVSILSFIYIAYLLIRPFFGISTGDGYSSIMAIVLFLGGVQLLSLGIIGEYIGRIFNESKNRPPYLIEEYNESKTSFKK